MNSILKKCLIIAGICTVATYIGFICYRNSPSYKMKKAYESLRQGKCLSLSQTHQLDLYLGRGHQEAKPLLLIDAFLDGREDEFDIIMEEEIRPDVNYGDMFRDAKQYLSENQTGRYAGFYYELRNHINHMQELDPASIRMPEEEAYYKGKLPTAGMKVIYFDICSLGEPDTVSVQRNAVGGGYHDSYDWYIDGIQVYHANAKDGYVIYVCDFFDHLTQPKDKENSNNSGSSSHSSHHSSSGHDAYDEGYEDIFYDDDYDWDRYWSDDDYASGVDDAMDELDW